MSGLYSFTGNSSSDLYSFLTDFGVQVSVYFTEGSYVFPSYPNFCELTYSFCIQTSRPIKGDPKVKETIIFILYSHFRVRPDSVLFWTCDQMDGKEKARNRKFESWFQKCKDQDFTKLNSAFVIDVEGIPNTTYASVVFLTENPFASEIESAFNSMESEFNDKDLSIVEE